ncbi:MAG TPA: radical SAM protein [Kofleriaceae bacterium]|nr:radical SAM protein [Kofleriaceae bacterium]
MDKQQWTTNLARVEIEICTVCNLTCPNCDRSSAQAPSQELMTVEQIQRFVDQSLALTWKWERITMLGGEPMLHPQLTQILEVLDRYRARAPETRFRIYSNGYGANVQRRLAALPAWIEVHNTNKAPDRPPLFSTYNVAPIDSPDCEGADYSKGCAITQWCGLGLTRYGFYPCGAGASVDRVFGLDLGLKQLADVTPERVVQQLTRLCSLCGHYRDFDRRVEFVKHRSLHVLSDWTTSQVTSRTWEAAYAAYRTQPPTLSLF